MNSSSQNIQNTENASDIFGFSGKEADIEYEFKGTLQKKGIHEGINYLSDNLVISYKLKNKGSKDFIIFNQGHSNEPNSNTIYVEPQIDGIIELSQRMFEKPVDKMCPLSFVPILPKGSLLKANSEISERALVELPLKTNTPFDACTPVKKMPKRANKVKFCIGIAEKDSKTQLNEAGFAIPTVKIERQKLLCSDFFEIK